jgi:hypothetical protein
MFLLIAAAMTPCTTTPPALPRRESSFRAFSAGRQFGSSQIVTNLQSGPAASYADVNSCVSKLNQYYRLRVHRQGRWTAYGSLVTATGALGSAFAKGTTRQSWALIGFAPVLANQFEGYTTTEKLFIVGAESLQALTTAYAAESDAFTKLEGRLSSLAATNQLTSLCDENARRLSQLRTWPLNEDRLAFEGEATRLDANCRALEVVTNQLMELKPTSYKTTVQNELIRSYQGDVLDLNESLMQRDSNARLKPNETLSKFLTAVPNAVSNLLTPESQNSAIQAVEQSDVLRGYVVRFSGLKTIPELSEMPHEAGPVGMQAAARVFASRPENSIVTASSIQAMYTGLVELQIQLTSERRKLLPMYSDAKAWSLSAAPRTWTLAPAQQEPRPNLLQVAP